MVGSGRGSCPGVRSRPGVLTWWAVRAAVRLCGGGAVVDAVVAVFVAGVRARSQALDFLALRGVPGRVGKRDSHADRSG